MASNEEATYRCDEIVEAGGRHFEVFGPDRTNDHVDSILLR
jgi:hypothetical protein